MSTPKSAPAAVSTFADHEVIVPPNRLKKAFGRVKPGAKIDVDPVARAEAALAELADDFATWMALECERLDAARSNLRASGITPGNTDTLFRAAHDIKGQAATFGFPQVAPIAESLCRLVEHIPDITMIPLALVDQHVDAIRAIATKNTRGDSIKYAAALAEKLRQVTDEFLVHTNRDRPDILESILAPPLAPHA